MPAVPTAPTLPDLTDPQQFDRFYRSNASDVLRWVIRLGGTLLDAEDVTHDVFSVAWKRRAQLTHGEPRAWLYGITRNVVANKRRRARLRRFVGLHSIAPVPDPRPGADERVEALFRRRLVQEALETLSDKHREAVVLFDLEELSAVEAAAMIGVSVGTVYSRLHHGRKRFGEALQDRRTALEQSLRRVELKG